MAIFVFLPQIARKLSQNAEILASAVSLKGAKPITGSIAYFGEFWLFWTDFAQF